MRETRSPEQKSHIIVHDEGVGAPSPEMIEERARELAVIAGRVATEYTDEDFRQAKEELIREQDEVEEEEEAEEKELPFEPGSGDVLGGRGHHAPNFGSDDDSTVGEKLVREGLDEALHDEMLEARKKNIHEAS